jgi:hypothetical protein
VTSIYGTGSESFRCLIRGLYLLTAEYSVPSRWSLRRLQPSP